MQDAELNVVYSTNGSYGLGYSQEFGTYATAPTVSISPENGSINILSVASIIFTFDEKIRFLDNSPVTTPADLISFTDSGSNNMNFTAEINPENTIITITPVSALTYEAEYTVTLASRMLENEYDMALEEDHFTTFTVQSEPANSVQKINASEINIYPNPSKDILNIDISLNSNANVDINITDILGKKVYFKNIGNLSAGNHTIVIDKLNLKSGFYYLNITNEDKIVTKKIAIKN